MRSIANLRGSRTVASALLVFTVVLFGAHEAAAQTSDDPSIESVLREWSWRNVGPIRGGRSISAVGSVARPLEYYFGAAGGGLWKTTDGGTTDRKSVV